MYLRRAKHVRSFVRSFVAAAGGEGEGRKKQSLRDFHASDTIYNPFPRHDLPGTYFKADRCITDRVVSMNLLLHRHYVVSRIICPDL